MLGAITTAFDWLRSAAGRSTSSVAVFAALIWFLWPEQNWHVHPDALAGLVVAVVAWLAALTPREKHSPSAHDRELLAKFRALLSDDEKAFLRQHDFGGTFSIHRLKGVRELADAWTGAEYEFDDKQVQDAFGALLAETSEFTHGLAHASGPTEQAGWHSVIPDRERHTDEISQRTYAAIDEFNRKATRLHDHIDKFIKFARQRIAD
jgi:hypothetical protein